MSDESKSVDVVSQAGEKVGSARLDPVIFAVQPNVPVMHQVVTAQLAARRAGTQSTLTRAEARGGGAKPWRQKGTGRARQGSNRAPHWRGGGVTHAPKPRSYRQRTPKKMVRLALCSALSDRAADDKIVVIDRWEIETPKTKDAVAELAALGVEGRTLIVLGEGDKATWQSFRNLPAAHCITAAELNTYDVLVADYIVFTKQTLPGESGESPAIQSDADTDSETETPVVIAADDIEGEADEDVEAKAGAENAEAES
jgi:large subunit ribosomal protein L4